jgi:uncharacterized OsmC-like protein/alpha/beta superfamily hydrolase
MRSQTLQFPNRRGDQLAARLDLPPDSDVIGCAIFAHCFTCSKNLSVATHISRAMVDRGFAVLRFDFTGLGQSDGNFADTHVSSNVDDLVAAAAMMEERYEAPVLLVGHSLGGAAVLLAAAKLPSVRAVVTIGAPFHPDHVRHLLEDRLEDIEKDGEATVVLAGRAFTIRRDFLADLEQHTMDRTIRELKRALLVMHAPLDDTVGVENAAHIFESARHPKSFISLHEADHLLTSTIDSRYAGSVIASWAQRYIDVDQPERKQAAPNDNRVVARTEAGSFRTSILANGHALVADEPKSVGGTNDGPSPYEYLAAGLAACTSMTLRMYADHKKWPLTAATTRVRHTSVHARDSAGESEKLDRFEREIDVEGDLDGEQRSRLLQIAERCPVHRTLEGSIEVTTKLDQDAAPGSESSELPRAQ